MRASRGLAREVLKGVWILSGVHFWRLLRLSLPFSGGVSRFRFLRGVGGGILWWSFPDVSEVSREIGVCVWVCCGVLS